MLNSEDLKKIMIKGLRVNYACSCSKKVLRMLEGQAREDLEDLLQDLELLNLEGASSEELFHHVDRFCNNRRKEEKSEISLIIDDDDENSVSEIDKVAYLRYFNNNNYVENQTFDIKKLELTDRQTEILNIYATTNSIRKTADILKVKASTIQVTIERIRNKLKILSA